MKCAQIGILTCSNSLPFWMRVPGQRAIPGACSQSVRDAKTQNRAPCGVCQSSPGRKTRLRLAPRSGPRFHGPGSPPRRFFCGRNAEIAIPGFDRGAGSSENLDDISEARFPARCIIKIGQINQDVTARKIKNVCRSRTITETHDIVFLAGSETIRPEEASHLLPLNFIRIIDGYFHVSLYQLLRNFLPLTIAPVLPWMLAAHFIRKRRVKQHLIV